MAKTMLTYTTINNIGERIQQLQKDHILRTRGGIVRLGALTEELATYCGVGPDAIEKVKLHINQPSLPVAMKIAEFFKCRPDEIFTLVPIRCPHCGTEWDGKLKESAKQLICGSCHKVFEPTVG